ncbi:type II toxin-antitoxin system antitoxin SocA domain-containing protein [Arthrobacter sp. D5-1]|uniref:Panacea domain-containing protein n=1 Tax=Arthrobacter sp. D5-1 TaxID=1477518 RepID=UPI001F61150C|nr:type II toxin-antitoxin system antitoxin SocA domain-containing protein [Arthrobacter sp. D5-1]
MTAMKLQKLAYYSQAWNLVWDERPLYEEGIQAWANGPVIYALYDKHRGSFQVSDWQWGNSNNLDGSEKETIDAVLDAYGAYTAHELSEMTHREDPWRDARRNLPEGARSAAHITQASLHEYYHGLSN